MRVPIPVPTSVILCVNKLGFGLVSKIQIFPLSGLTGQSGVHQTLHCAMSGASAAARSKSIFLCVVRWFTGQLLCAVWCAPDRHYRLSGAPISGF
jgi:hypothetical protein